MPQIKFSAVQIVGLTVFCHSMCFFGYVYEEIVDIPNMLGSHGTISGAMWAGYHVVTDPSVYHAPATILGIIFLIFIWLRKSEFDFAGLKKLKLATSMIVLANLLTIVAVTRINNSVFFGKPYDGSFTNLAWIWAVLNFFRLSFVFIAIWALVNILSEKWIEQRMKVLSSNNSQ